MARKITQLCESSALSDLKLYQYGSSRYTASIPDRPILSAYYSVCYVSNGEGEVRIGNFTYPIKTGNVFIVFPNQVRKFIPGSSGLEIQRMEIDGAVLSAELSRLNLSPNHPMLSLSVPAGTSKTAEYFSQLAAASECNEATCIGLCWMILGAMMAETAQIKPQRLGNQRKEYVQQAIDMIERCYMLDITVEDIAEHCRLNRSYLGKLFRDETGESTQEYLIRYRMTVACRYLMETTAPIGTIAMSVGYQNQLHFSRAFRKTFGVSPRDWQKQQRMRLAAERNGWHDPFDESIQEPRPHDPIDDEE